MLGHDVRHELLGLLVNVIRVDQDVANVVVEVIADGTNHQARFLINQEGAFAAFGCAVNGAPQFEEVVQVPLQLGCRAANAGGARNDGHAVGVLQLVHRLFEFGAVITFNTAADATAARVVGHQNHIAASQRDKGGQGSAFVATLFFFHLNQQLLAFADGVLNASLAGRHASLEILFGDFLERQKAVAVFAVVHKAGFQRGLDAGHHRFVNIAFALLAAFDFNFIVEQFLPVDNGQSAFFRLSGVDQHPFHDAFLHVLNHHRPMTGQRCRNKRQKTKGMAARADMPDQGRCRWVGAWMGARRRRGRSACASQRFCLVNRGSMRGVRDATRAGSSQRRQSVNITITLIMFVASRCDPLQSRSWGACSLGIPLQSFLGIGSTLKGRIARATKAKRGCGAGPQGASTSQHGAVVL